MSDYDEFVAALAEQRENRRRFQSRAEVRAFEHGALWGANFMQQQEIANQNAFMGQILVGMLGGSDD